MACNKYAITYDMSYCLRVSSFRRYSGISPSVSLYNIPSNMFNRELKIGRKSNISSIQYCIDPDNPSIQYAVPSIFIKEYKEGE